MGSRHGDEAQGAAASRSPEVIRAELAEAQRYLLEAPPHHGAGVRAALEARITALQRELREAGG